MAIFSRSTPPEGEADSTAAKARKTLLGAPRWATFLLAFIVLAVLYWGLLGWFIHDTETDLSLRPAPDLLTPGASMTAAYLVTVTESELDRGGWTPNDSILSPTAALDEMPAFQTGVHDVLAATAAAYAQLVDDEALTEAAEDYAVEPTRGFFHGSFPFIGGSAGAHYSDGAEAFADYNRSLDGAERLRPESGADAAALLGALSDSMQDTMAEIDGAIREGEIDTPAGVLHARVRGQAYAAALILRGIRTDFEGPLRQRQMGSTMVAAIEQFDRVASENPFSVSESDLTGQGYFLRSGLEGVARMQAAL